MTDNRKSNLLGPTRASILTGMALSVATLAGAVYVVLHGDSFVAWALGDLATVMMIGRTLGQIARYGQVRRTNQLVIDLRSRPDRTADDHFGGRS